MAVLYHWAKGGTNGDVFYLEGIPILIKEKWSHQPDLNRWPIAYEATALPAELWWHSHGNFVTELHSGSNNCMGPQYFGLFVFQEYLYRVLYSKGMMGTEVVLHEIVRKKTIPDLNWFRERGKVASSWRVRLNLSAKAFIFGVLRKVKKCLIFSFCKPFQNEEGTLLHYRYSLLSSRNTEGNVHSSEEIRSILWSWSRVTSGKNNTRKRSMAVMMYFFFPFSWRTTVSRTIKSPAFWFHNQKWSSFPWFSSFVLPHIFVCMEALKYHCPFVITSLCCHKNEFWFRNHHLQTLSQKLILQSISS